MKTITSLDIWIPAILVNNKKDILLTLAIWNDEEKEPVFYAGKAGPYFLSDLCDKKGIPLNEYAVDEPYYFCEWWRCLCKERQREIDGKIYITEYCFTETGDEYWYQTDDFHRHYTKIEG